MMNSQSFMHNSHERSFRSPFGAVACLQPVYLKITVPENTDIAYCTLRLWEEKTGEILLPMKHYLAAQEEGFETTFVPRQLGLVWYYFILEGAGKKIYYGNNQAGFGGVGKIAQEPPPSYQLTVYETAPVPKWYKEGLMYQIFVDRFNRGGSSNLKFPAGALTHTHWEDVPVYTKDIQTGEMLAYDFFGGNLQGIMEKLPYLQGLGVTILYLNPIFEAASNHKYDTGNYEEIDASFGTNELFQELCEEAKKQGIAIILDGVFSHTGSDSVYFNKDGHYSSLGAYQSKQSPYYAWYRFEQFPDKYESWWGVDTLPNVDEMQPAYREFMLSSENSVVRQWLKRGAKGWRLDVVDELPALFVKELRQVVKETDSEAVIIGEVWEDASNKTSYSERREYLLGQELDSTMNYPFRRIAVDFILGNSSAYLTHCQVMGLYENYPAEHFFSAMNLIGSHDVPRILSLLGDDSYTGKESIGTLGRRKLTNAQRTKAKVRLKLLVLWQMTFPGVPCIYYGDEAGLEGYTDPLNRRTYPWGQEDQELMAWYHQMIELRQQDVFKQGDFSSFALSEDVYAFIRNRGDQHALVILNRSDQAATVTMNAVWLQNQGVEDVLWHEPVLCDDKGQWIIRLRPCEGKILMTCEESQHDDRTTRRSGVLLHPTSLSSKDQLGAIDESAFQFIDFLAGAKQKLWQILPLNPVGFGESPYQCFSAFAGNPLLIDLQQLTKEKYKPCFDEQPAEYEKARDWKEKQLRSYFAQYKYSWQDTSYVQFCLAQQFWLADYCLFMAFRQKYGSPWSNWPQKIRERNKAALDKAKRELKEEIDYQAFLQYTFFSQWSQLRQYGASKNISFIGDMPLYVAYDSADVWSRPELFDLDSSGSPRAVAGVPPDYFSSTGQLWGNPLYDWQAHEDENYAWWCQRVNTLLQYVDEIRFDHFRGLEAYYSVPSHAATAEHGQWCQGPGTKILAAFLQQWNPLPLIAEDLGVITPAVIKLKEEFQLPGMQVLQFSFYDTSEGWARLSVPKQSFVYTGTHDNNTTLGWYRQSMRGTRAESCLNHYLGSISEQNIAAKLVELAFASHGRTVIVPVQDLLGLDEKSRMNTPGTVGGNWHFRLNKGQLDQSVQLWLVRLTDKYFRS